MAYLNLFNLQFPVALPQGYHALSFWLVQNLSEGFPTSGNDNDNNTNIGFFDTLRLAARFFIVAYMAIRL